MASYVEKNVLCRMPSAFANTSYYREYLNLTILQELGCWVSWRDMAQANGQREPTSRH